MVPSNPNSGKLSAQLEASKSQARVPQEREEERLVVRAWLVDVQLWGID